MPRSCARLQVSSGPELNGSREKSGGRLQAPDACGDMSAAADEGSHPGRWRPFPKDERLKSSLVDSVIFLFPQLPS